MLKKEIVGKTTYYLTNNDLGMENIDPSPSLSDDNYFESIVKEIDSDSNNNKSD